MEKNTNSHADAPEQEDRRSKLIAELGKGFRNIFGNGFGAPVTVGDSSRQPEKVVISPSAVSGEAELIESIRKNALLSDEGSDDQER